MDIGKYEISDIHFRRMKIGLIDVDGHGFPNLALMKISAFHKKNNDNVQWYDMFVKGGVE
jgi:hypothetical protein